MKNSRHVVFCQSLWPKRTTTLSERNKGSGPGGKGEEVSSTPSPPWAKEKKEDDAPDGIQIMHKHCRESGGHALVDNLEAHYPGLKRSGCNDFSSMGLKALFGKLSDLETQKIGLGNKIVRLKGELAKSDEALVEVIRKLGEVKLLVQQRLQEADLLPAGFAESSKALGIQVEEASWETSDRDALQDDYHKWESAAKAAALCRASFMAIGSRLQARYHPFAGGRSEHFVEAAAFRRTEQSEQAVEAEEQAEAQAKAEHAQQRQNEAESESAAVRTLAPRAAAGSGRPGGDVPNSDEALAEVLRAAEARAKTASDADASILE